ncbi:MAG: invasion associated locus B family protein [Xanthobacteraceae bacterium]|nr:invasion associated locus B family protein [Xanthobacteraceae bacterium]
MRAAASYLFCVIVFCVMILAALSAVPAASEEPDSSWKKFCLNDVCTIGKGRRSDCGLIGEVTLVERNTETGKRLSMALPARITPDRNRAIRVTIDGNKPVSREISRCDCACWVDDKGGWDLVELVEQLKQGQWLVLEALTSRRQPHIVVMPLAGFAEAYNGPPTPMPQMKERMASQPR